MTVFALFSASVNDLVSDYTFFLAYMSSPYKLSVFEDSYRTLFSNSVFLDLRLRFSSLNLWISYLWALSLS